MLETAAVYWESKVRIYGFRERIGLSFFTLVFPADRLEHWGTEIQAMEGDNGAFELVVVQEIDKKFQKFILVVTEKPDCSYRHRIEEAVQKEEGTSFAVDFPVEMISFHGPHFQDRYGIASAAFEALEKSDFPILASGCTGTSIYLVLPENKARSAVSHLGETFIIPRTDGQ